jgi:hypothetical protein
MCCLHVVSGHSASARISKGQGYQGFIRKRAGSSFGQKRAICVVQGKTWRRTRKNLKHGQNFTTSRVNKMFSHVLTHLITNKLPIILFKGLGAPWEVKGH